MLDMASRVFRPKDILWRWDGKNSDIIIAMSSETYDIEILNPTASEIFSLCNGKRSILEIIEELNSRFTSVDTNIEGDVIACILELRKKGLIDLVGGDNG
jgi:coenzyme PQQ biosynthesis protein PqqD